MRLWYARMLSYAPMTPSPRTAPTATVGDGNPDQVLLLGNGPLHGWGVMSHGVSVVGHLHSNSGIRPHARRRSTSSATNG